MAARLPPFLFDAFSGIGAVFGGGVGAYFASRSFMPMMERRFPGRPAIQSVVGGLAVIFTLLPAAGVGYALVPNTVNLGYKAFHAPAAITNGVMRDIDESIDERRRRKQAMEHATGSERERKV